MQAERRRSPRTRLSHARSSLGQVTDVSEHGLCVFVKGAVPAHHGEHLSLDVTMDDRTVHLQTHVVRVTPMGLRRHELGLVVDTADDGAAEALQWMIQRGETLGTSPRAFRSED